MGGGCPGEFIDKIFISHILFVAILKITWLVKLLHNFSFKNLHMKHLFMESSTEKMVPYLIIAKKRITLFLKVGYPILNSPLLHPYSQITNRNIWILKIMLQWKGFSEINLSLISWLDVYTKKWNTNL